ncbi:MAG: hypothetical protein HY783_04925 [Chloroflexi bacterium]|nr:hypothetical protein [Chloroflexota bacterium]
MTKPGGQVISYDLDAANKRATKKVNGMVQRKWLYGSGLLPVAELDGNNTLVSVFNGGGYMAKNGTNYRILRDHLGSVRLVVDAGTGAVAQRMSYDQHGNVTEDTNPGFQPFGYAGGLYDPDTGLVRFGARDYDPTVGRWTCRDPVGLEGGPNVYAYCHDDSINYRDRSGLDSGSEGPGHIFIDPDAAAMAASRRIASQTRRDSTEMGGVIYRISRIGPDGKEKSLGYSYTTPILPPKGKNIGPKIAQAADCLLSRNKNSKRTGLKYSIIALYHSHAFFRDYTNEEFSPTDMAKMMSSKIPGYVLTTGWDDGVGDVLFYDYRMGDAPPRHVGEVPMTGPINMDAIPRL